MKAPYIKTLIMAVLALTISSVAKAQKTSDIINSGDDFCQTANMIAIVRLTFASPTLPASPEPWRSIGPTPVSAFVSPIARHSGLLLT